MTSKEIMAADLLDILFENRNKDYGAYALRRTYNHRLLLAIGGTLSVILLFILIRTMNKNDPPPHRPLVDDNGYKISIVVIPKIIEPELPVQTPKPFQRTASIRQTSTIIITPDERVKHMINAIEDLKGKEISTVTNNGIPLGLARPIETVSPRSGNTGPVEPINNFVISERPPEFPGGPEALRKFLASNLNTPEDLEVGDKKMVQIRFWVGTDGIVANLEIMNSGGLAFDREVTRVCKKMPRWKPAIQNGVTVAVSYILPVTFIGVEQ